MWLFFKMQNKRFKRTNNHLQNTTKKHKNWTTRIPIKTGGEHVCFYYQNNAMELKYFLNEFDLWFVRSQNKFVWMEIVD